MENGVWRTVSGRRIFIKDGQSLTEAMKESGKFKTKEKYSLEYWKAKGVRILDEPPKGWVKVEGATTAPRGYDWWSNNKSLFGGERKTALVKRK